MSLVGELPDFLAFEIDGGYARIRVNLGDVEVTLRLDANTGSTRLNDGNWHSIEFIYDHQVTRSYKHFTLQ